MSQAGILTVEESILPPDVPINFQGNTGTGASAVDHLMNIVGRKYNHYQRVWWWFCVANCHECKPNKSNSDSGK